MESHVREKLNFALWNRQVLEHIKGVLFPTVGINKRSHCWWREKKRRAEEEEKGQEKEVKREKVSKRDGKEKMNKCREAEDERRTEMQKKGERVCDGAEPESRRGKGKKSETENVSVGKRGAEPRQTKLLLVKEICEGAEPGSRGGEGKENETKNLQKNGNQAKEEREEKGRTVLGYPRHQRLLTMMDGFLRFV